MLVGVQASCVEFGIAQPSSYTVTREQQPQPKNSFTAILRQATRNLDQICQKQKLLEINLA